MAGAGGAAMVPAYEDVPALPASATTAPVPVAAPFPIEILPQLEHHDARLVALWLHGRSLATQRAYAAVRHKAEAGFALSGTDREQ
jgi:hypothetical protein